MKIRVSESSSSIKSAVDRTLIEWAVSLDCEVKVEGEGDHKIYCTRFHGDNCKRQSVGWRSSREVYCYLTGIGDERYKDVKD